MAMNRTLTIELPGLPPSSNSAFAVKVDPHGKVHYYPTYKLRTFNESVIWELKRYRQSAEKLQNKIVLVEMSFLSPKWIGKTTGRPTIRDISGNLQKYLIDTLFRGLGLVRGAGEIPADEYVFETISRKVISTETKTIIKMREITPLTTRK